MQKVHLKRSHTRKSTKTKTRTEAMSAAKRFGLGWFGRKAQQSGLTIAGGENGTTTSISRKQRVSQRLHEVRGRGLKELHSINLHGNP